LRQSGGFGLVGMEERVLALGGTLDISWPAGGGILIEVRLPLVEPNGDIN
jgi:two-component system, NarL family, sensor histidine kinase UhpB